MRMKYWIRCCSIVVLVFLLTACGKSVEKQIQEQLELGQKYLQEMDYEQAIVAFQKVIQLDEKHVDAYLGLGQAHEGQAEQIRESDADAAMAYYRQAAQMYEKVQEINPADQESYQKLVQIYKKLGELEKLRDLLERHQDDSEEAKEQWEQTQSAMDLVKQISALCEAEDFTQVFELMQSEAYQELRLLSQQLGYPAFVIEGSKGLGLYPVETEEFGNCMIYYGDYEDGKRQGQGLWLGYHNNNNYRAQGAWSGDKPNGQQKVREWSGSLASVVSTRVITGSVTDGLWNGPAMWEFEQNDNRVVSFPVSFTNGKWNIIRIDEDSVDKYVVSDSGNTDSGIMSIDNLDDMEGIEGYK